MTDEKTSGAVAGEIPVAFGPNSFTPKGPGPEERLYSEDISPANARSIGETVIKAAEGIGKVIGKVGERGVANARSYPVGGFDVPAPYGADSEYRETDIVPIENYIRSEPKSQSWLQRVTGKINEYVFGASVPEGEDEGTYVDMGLYENAKRYLSAYWDRAKDRMREYAADFIEGIITDGHEMEGHYIEGHDGSPEGERAAEGAGVTRLRDFYRTGDEATTEAVGIAGGRYLDLVT